MNIHIFWGILLQRKSLKHIYHSFKQLRHHSLHSAARILFLLHANKPLATTVYFEGHFGNLSSDFRKISGLGLWMVDGMGFWGLAWMDRGFLQMSKMTGFFVPTGRKVVRDLPGILCHVFVVFVKVVFSSHGKRKEKFLLLVKNSMFLVLLFFVAGFFIP